MRTTGQLEVGKCYYRNTGLTVEVASHRQCGMLWWDAGRLRFLSDSRDLAAKDFLRTYAYIQTS